MTLKEYLHTFILWSFIFGIAFLPKVYEHHFSKSDTTSKATKSGIQSTFNKNEFFIANF